MWDCSEGKTSSRSCGTVAREIQASWASLESVAWEGAVNSETENEGIVRDS